MILVDTSIWIDQFRGLSDALDRFLADDEVLLHPFVYGELLLGGLVHASPQAGALRQLAPAPLARPDEVAPFIAWAGLAGTGVGYVDTHLLVSARVAGARLLTLDRRLAAQARRLGMSPD